jgi:hypothetical protein
MSAWDWHIYRAFNSKDGEDSFTVYYRSLREAEDDARIQKKLGWSVQIDRVHISRLKTSVIAGLNRAVG